MPANVSMENPKKIDYVPLGIVVFFFLACVVCYLVVIAKGFTPIDDALRHVAKVVSGKTWDQILVFRSDFDGKMDTHPGWHALLSSFNLVGPGKDGLICISMAIPWVFMFVTFLVFLERPECLIIILVTFFLMDPASCIRLFCGRPFLVAMDITMAYLFLWGVAHKSKPTRSLLIATITLSAVHVWIHPSWYLLGLPIFSVFVSGILKKDISKPIYFTTCIIFGIIIGALLSLHPVDILVQNFRILKFAIFGDVPVMATEFKSFFPSTGTVAILIIALIPRLWIDPWPGVDWRHPAVILTFFGLGMGFFIGRFWADWGFVGALVWLCLDLQGLIRAKIGERRLSRLFTAGVASALLVVAASGSVNLFPQFNITQDVSLIRKSYAEDKTWFPGDRGIVYSNSMNTFYRFFYTLPQGNWRYILGYEQGLMPKEDRAILHSTVDRISPFDGYEGWVKKMKPEDRLVIFGDAINKGMVEKHPFLSRLEWKFATTNYILGRLRKDENLRLQPVAK